MKAGLFRICAVVAWALGIAQPVQAAASVGPLRLFNREVTELRAVLGGLSPSERAERAERRFAALAAADEAQPLLLVFEAFPWSAPWADRLEQSVRHMGGWLVGGLIGALPGLMVTLGSTGVVTQLMSGLVVVYSRSLRKGDFVSVNGIEGVVGEVGALAVKITTLRNEEVTIPNAVITGSAIHNFSKLAGQQGTLLSTRLTIGYDTAWRQVHAMLVRAAQATPGVRAEPTPFVYQRALSDFYVEYELFVLIDRPLERLPILSALHAAVQDEFNRHGVQIMSPHFVEQPPQAVMVPPSRWGVDPAARP